MVQREFLQIMMVAGSSQPSLTSLSIVTCKEVRPGIWPVEVSPVQALQCHSSLGVYVSTWISPFSSFRLQCKLRTNRLYGRRNPFQAIIWIQYDFCSPLCDELWGLRRSLHNSFTQTYHSSLTVLHLRLSLANGLLIILVSSTNTNWDPGKGKHPWLDLSLW